MFPPLNAPVVVNGTLKVALVQTIAFGKAPIVIVCAKDLLVAKKRKTRNTKLYKFFLFILFKNFKLDN
jgi:hypothetical protein